MATRSVVAIPHGDAWRGRYVHYDGYPTNMGPALTGIVRRVGLAKAVETLVESHYGWSSIDPNTTAEDFGYAADAKTVEGYGICYADNVPDNWHTPEHEPWTEWAYVLTAGGLLVVKQGYRSHDVVVGLYDWNTDHDWEAIQQQGYDAINAVYAAQDAALENA